MRNKKQRKRKKARSVLKLADTLVLSASLAFFFFLSLTHTNMKINGDFNSKPHG